MSTSSVCTRNPAALWRRVVGGEVLLALPERSDVDRLSVPASAVWLALAQPRMRAELIRALADEFGTSAEEIAERAERLIDELETRGWLLTRPSDA